MNVINKLKYIALFGKSYWMSKKFSMPNVMNDSDTLDYILQNGCSVVRYGDGELNLMRGVGIKFQKKNKELKSRLHEIATADYNTNILICVPNIFKTTEIFTDECRKWWKHHLYCNRGYWYRYFRLNLYGDTNITRFYVENTNKNRDDYAARLKELWKNKRLLIAEGAKSRLGMGNDLFSTAQSIKRIICPSTNAFELYDRILSKVNEQIDTGEFDILVCALGPTATVLCYDVANRIQALDLGHVDIEYEWYLVNAQSKQAVKNKSVTEVIGDCDDETDSSYRKQIIGEVL